jgi:hypothetical protein
MDTSEHSTHPPSLKDWYGYAAEQPWAIDSYLRVVRVHEGKTQEQQRNEFGVSQQEFLRLRGMPLPRTTSFPKDAQRIAEECHVQNPWVFIQTLLLAKQLTASTQSSLDSDQFYEAAFDALDDLDAPPEAEKG